MLKEDIFNQLNYVISIKMKDPHFCGNIKRELQGQDVYTTVKLGVMECLKNTLAQDPYFFYSSGIIGKSSVRRILNKNN